MTYSKFLICHMHRERWQIPIQIKNELLSVSASFGQISYFQHLSEDKRLLFIIMYDKLNIRIFIKIYLLVWFLIYLHIILLRYLISRSLFCTSLW